MRSNYTSDGPPPETNALNHHREEPNFVVRSRAARAMLSALRDEGSPMSDKTKKKVEKALNVELFNAMNEAREVYIEGQANLGKTSK